MSYTRKLDTVFKEISKSRGRLLSLFSLSRRDFEASASAGSCAACTCVCHDAPRTRIQTCSPPSIAQSRTFSTLRALSTEMQLGVEMPDKGSETKVESEVENPVHSKPKLDFIKVNVPDNLQFDRNH